MKRLLPAIAVCLAISVHAQKKTKADPAAGINPENLREKLYRVASAEFEGRETAMPGQRKAAAYIESYFRSLGLAPGNKDSFQLAFPVYRDSLLSASLLVNDDSFALWKDYFINLAPSYSSTIASSDVVFVGYGLSDSLRDDYKGLDVRGKIVLVLNGYPPELVAKLTTRKNFNPYAKQDAAQAHGAVAVLMWQTGFPVSPENLGRMYQSLYRSVVRPPTWMISEKLVRSIVGDDLAGLHTAAPGKLYHANVFLSFAKQIRFLHSTDVLGYLEGTDLKSQLLVISAHYDHLGKNDSTIWYGADDDGSGTVSLLQIAQAFADAKKNGKGPRRSILFLANSGEEKGLWGSDYFTSHPTYPLDSMTADLNIDMIGRRDPGRTKGDSTNYVYVIGDDKISTELHGISTGANKRYTKLELDYKFNDPADPLRIYYRSDHYNFAKHGVPVIFYFDGIHKDYHQPSDTPDKIDYADMAKRARLVFWTAWDMANRDAIVKRNLPIPTETR